MKDKDNNKDLGGMLLGSVLGSMERQKRAREIREVDAPEIERVCQQLERIASGIAETVSIEARNKMILSIHSAIAVLLEYKGGAN